MNKSSPALKIAIVIALLASTGVAALQLQQARSSEAAGAILGFPATTCSDEGASITFNWLPMNGASEQTLDFSVADNNFLPGTFESATLAGDARSYTASAVHKHHPHFWRVNSRTQNGWVTSATGMLTPCDWPVLLVGPVICQTHEIATAEFRWAPRADAIGNQWLEISRDGSFSDAVRVGPLALSAQSFRRGGFEVGETYAFRVVWDGAGHQVPTQVGWFTPECTASAISSILYGSDDRLVVPRLGINAPVNVRDVGFDGFLGVPEGAYDVVRYNFGQFPRLAGYPGEGGVTMIGGHVDFYTVGLAVFAPLRQAQAGDIIEYHRGDGITITYVVDWVSDLPFSTGLNGYLHNRGVDEILLVTCNGTFDRESRNYDLRRLVHAVRVH
jgi:hypothetical protein